MLLFGPLWTMVSKPTHTPTPHGPHPTSLVSPWPWHIWASPTGEGGLRGMRGWRVSHCCWQAGHQVEGPLATLREKCNYRVQGIRQSRLVLYPIWIWFHWNANYIALEVTMWLSIHLHHNKSNVWPQAVSQKTVERRQNRNKSKLCCKAFVQKIKACWSMEDPQIMRILRIDCKNVSLTSPWPPIPIFRIGGK